MCLELFRNGSAHFYANDFNIPERENFLLYDSLVDVL